MIQNDQDKDPLNMNPLNEQGEPVLKSYNSDPNNYQMNMILGGLRTWISIASYLQYAFREIKSVAFKRAQSADEFRDESGDVKRLEFTTG